MCPVRCVTHVSGRSKNPNQSVGSKDTGSTSQTSVGVPGPSPRPFGYRTGVIPASVSKRLIAAGGWSSKTVPMSHLASQIATL
jgi:hypothetical protein